MLPAHGYPKLKAFLHLAGNYGGAWVDQADEFTEFPGAILMMSNCIQQPKTLYKQRIFTSRAVAWPGVRHIDNRDFSAVIAAALASPRCLPDTKRPGHPSPGANREEGSRRRSLFS
jgi:hydroxylamine reductase